MRAVAPRHSECCTTSTTTAAYNVIIIIIIIIISYRKADISATIRHITGACRAPAQGDYTIVTVK